jgi:hypothetical protein
MTDKSSFPFPHHLELTLIEGCPTPQSLKKLCSEVYDNAMDVPSEAGDGQYGHLGAVMPAAQHQALHGAVAYVAPANLGIQAPTPANATAIQISQANRQHDKALERFSKHHDICAELKRLILAAIDDCYISALQEEVLGYAQVSVDALLMHLNMTYSTINQEVLEMNRNNVSAKWNPDDGIKTIFTHIALLQGPAPSMLFRNRPPFTLLLLQSTTVVSSLAHVPIGANVL